MRIEVLIIGSEIITGVRQDANIRFLSASLLKRFGLTPQKVTVLADDREKLLKFLKHSCDTADLLIVTGGLGPTKDDLTKNIFAELSSEQLVFSAQSHQLAQGHYRRLRKDFDYQLDIDHPYAYLAQSWLPLENPVGLAPGVIGKVGQMAFALFPGVPSEFQKMLSTHIKSILDYAGFKQQKFIAPLFFQTYGIPEEEIFKQNPTLWDELETLGLLSSLPSSKGGVELVIRPKIDLTPDELTQKALKIFSQYPKVYNSIWQIGNLSIEKLILKKAIDQKIKIAFAESCTAGGISSKLSNISGASQIFLGSVVCYENQVKQKLLGVSETTLRQSGAVSSETVEQMLVGLRKTLGADLGLAISGILGPTGGSVEKPVGTVFIGIDFPQKNIFKVEKFQFRGRRLQVKSRAILKAMHLILQTMA